MGLAEGASLVALDMDRRSALHYAVRGDVFLNVTKLLVERGADIERADIIGFRPLHVSCYENQQATAAFLVGLGADLYAMDKAGWNPLVHAAAREHVSLVDWLIVETLKPRKFPLPNPDMFVRQDITAPVFGGMPGWLLALLVIFISMGAFIPPACCILRRFDRLRKPYICSQKDEDLEEFVNEIFDLLHARKGEQEKVCQE